MTSETKRAWNDAHRAERAAYQREYHQKHAAELKAKARAKYRETHPVVCRHDHPTITTAESATRKNRTLRLIRLQSYLDKLCDENHIDEEYRARASELLPKAATIGTKEYVAPGEGYRRSPHVEAIVDALLYVVIADDCGVQCSIAARRLHEHQKRKSHRLVNDIRVVTGLKGRARPALARDAAEKLGLTPAEADDIKAMLGNLGFSPPGDPTGVVAAVIYLYCKQRRPYWEQIGQNVLRDVLHITEVTIRSRLNDILAAGGLP